MVVFNPEVPFNELPLLPPRTNLETPEIFRICIEANKELAKLKMAERLIPNQTVLINSIPLLESQASSAIENIVTTTDDLFRFADDRTSVIKPEVKETLSYRTALYQGFNLIKKHPLTVPTICEICSIIRETETDIRKLPGTALVNDVTGKKIYTPPQGEAVIRDLLTDWQNFVYREDNIDPLIKLAVQHYQFEAIHPFTDGNGRTGRIINLLFLVDKGLLDTPILYLSKYIIQNKEAYYDKLLKVTTDQAWTEWIIYFLQGVRETARWTNDKILAIQNLIDSTGNFVQKNAAGIYDKDIIEQLFVQPYIRINDIVEKVNIGRFTASKYLKILCEIDVLVELKVGREKIFINKKFLNLLQKN